MVDVSADEKKVYNALRKCGGRAFTKQIAEKAGMSPQTASKYLGYLAAKSILRKDVSTKPHIYWETVKEI